MIIVIKQPKRLIMPKTSFTSDINGQTFEFKGITTTDAGNIPLGGRSQILRQYLKQKWPKVKFQIATDSFAGGTSVDVYTKDPSQVDDELFEEIRSDIRATFSMGTFNGMTDMYEMHEGGAIVYQESSGYKQPIDFKYVFVKKEPKFGTKAYEAWKSN